MSRMLLLFCFSLFFLSANGQSIQKQLNQFAAYYEGIYSSKNFSDTTKEKFLREQETIVMPITTNTDDRWFYYGWFPPKDREQPLEEVFVRLFIQNDSIKLFFYTIPQEARNSKPWGPETPFRLVNFKQLIADGDNGQCDVWMKAKNEYGVRSYKHIEQKFSNTGRYHHVEYQAVFYTDYCVSAAKFVTADGKVVLDHKGIFHFDKIGKKFKKFGDMPTNVP